MPSRQKIAECSATLGRKTHRRTHGDKTNLRTRNNKITLAAGAATQPYGRDPRKGRDDRRCVSNPRNPSKINRGWLKHTRHKIFQASSREYSLNDCFAGSFSSSTNLL